MKTVDDYLDSVEHLPPAPTVLLELMDLFKEQDQDIDRIVELIAHDPSLTAEMLKLCNSAYFSGATPADDMFSAVTRLGLYEVYRTVATIFGSRTFSADVDRGGLNMVELWGHSVTTAVAAETLAKSVGENEGAAFTSALLHDLGKIVLASAAAGEYVQLIQEAGNAGKPLSEEEKTRFGVQHAEIAGRLLTRWNFPENLVTAVAHHNAPADATPFESLTACVKLGSKLACLISQGQRTVPADFQLPLDALGILKIHPDELPRFLEQTVAGLERVKGLTAAAA